MATKPPVAPKRKFGGPQPGSGRPRGSVSQKTKEAAERILKGQTNIKPEDLELPDDATPLDVMIEAMRCAYKLAGAIGAFSYAKEAAPYLHARINSITLNNGTGQDGEVTAFKYEVEFVNAKNGKPA